MPFENFDEAVLFNEKLSLEIPEEAVKSPTMPAVKLPTMPEDISLDTVYVVDGKLMLWMANNLQTKPKLNVIKNDAKTKLLRKSLNNCHNPMTIKPSFMKSGINIKVKNSVMNATLMPKKPMTVWEK